MQRCCCCCCLLVAQELEAAMADGDMPQRKSARSVKRRNFADLEEPPPEDDDSWELGDDSDSERLGGGVGGGSRKRRRSSAAAAGGPAEDRRFGECVCVCRQTGSRQWKQLTKGTAGARQACV